MRTLLLYGCALHVGALPLYGCALPVGVGTFRVGVDLCRNSRTLLGVSVSPSGRSVIPSLGLECSWLIPMWDWLGSLQGPGVTSMTARCIAPGFASFLHCIQPALFVQERLFLETPLAFEELFISSQDVAVALPEFPCNGPINFFFQHLGVEVVAGHYMFVPC